ncbi:fumarylacetoacetate hydrolase family protein [Streptomyces sp. NPDC057474]|uniref:fumarylacetoacetate hydrolase family protein n=1 Tax=Streptomyces sp. NPDC057474 TaxID=3346144 RepID=UPI0036C95126
MFDPQVAVLAERYRCVAIDWRGQGETPRSESGYDMDSLTEDVIALLAELRLDPVAFEGEIALVIGTETHRVSRDTAWQHVSGVTAANDFGLYDLRYADPGSNVHSKSLDGCTPIGPAVLDAAQLDPSSLHLRTYVNGRLEQDARVADDMLFDFAYVIADLSRFMTLQPGDVILTGTPAGSSVVQPGDVVEVEVTGTGLNGLRTSTGRLRTSIAKDDYRVGALLPAPQADAAARAAAYGHSASQATGATPRG